MPDTPHAAGARAVFLSYAREDADAARRIADALRAFGVEVWFDQSELRGGDAWDQKIRKQIKDCTLFVPMISATTQARGEGYFRREWKLGVDRTHDMSSARSFILPIVIDDTKESEAEVPEEFMRYQWTRLPHGVPSSQFVDLVKGLLSKEPGAGVGRGRPTQPSGAAHAPQAGSGRSGEGTGRDPALQAKRLPSWLLPVAVGLVVAAGVFLVMRKPDSAPPTPPPGATPAAVESKPAPPVNDKSIAVLPFANMSEDKENAFFTDGVHEDILTNLAYIRDLRSCRAPRSPNTAIRRSRSARSRRN